MEKGRRWLVTIFLLIGLFTLGPKKLEPLWDTVRHDPAIGILIGVVLMLLGLVVFKVVRH